ncbi:cytochrome c oxidase assembly protein COX19-like [Gigantopelta aegis]|uniref:cytochrome c oxidase assembly protein COX19-like n=1 Tax=Gigantopelta aegis TaxID=1735272 RepID=UPI001B88D9A6|nr:cytochrome c oxidase assembly protein COX19-like [Gigantopelta aegis]
MSTQMTFANKSFVKPPEKGSFPLDHKGECKEVMFKYMRCLRRNELENTKCRETSLEYLKCRMEKNLMQKEDYDKLGFRDIIQEDSQKVNDAT